MHLIIIHSCFTRSADCFLLYHKSALPPSSPFKRPCKCGTLELIAEMRNQYTEYRICFAVRTGESTKINSTKITNLIYFWKSTKIYSLENSLPNALEQLYMHYTRLSSRAAIALFTALKDNDKLKVLNVHYNVITDDACDAIITVLERNNSLVSLGLYHNPLSIEATMNIVQCLEGNNTLQVLGLPKCLKDVQEYIKSLEEVVNKRREGRGSEVKLEIKLINISTTR